MDRPIEQRLGYIDATKAFAILCVLIGHAIQWTGSGDPYHDSVLFQFIYAFHMPLFFTVSGFFMYKSFALSPKDFVLRRAKQLLLPVLSFVTLFYGLMKLVLEPLLHVEPLGKPYFDMLFESELWFLKYLFAGLAIAYASVCLFRKTWVAALLPTVILVFCFRIGVYRVLPFLWLGYALHRYDSLIANHLKLVTCLSAVVFGATLCLWCGDYDATLAVVSLHGGVLSFSGHGLFVTLERIAVGASGSVFFITATRWLFSRPTGRAGEVFVRIGRNTLGIYCVQRYLLEYALDSIEVSLPEAWLPVFNVAVAVVMLFVFDALVELLKRSRILALLFLGR